MTSDLPAEGGVDDRVAEARALGTALADLTEDPEAFVSALRRGLEGLADAGHAALLARVRAGSGPSFGVRSPLLRTVRRPVERALAEGSSSSALWLGQRLAQAEEREVRLLTVTCLRRSLPDDPERTWQQMRRLASGADGWVEVDTQADLWVAGVLAEPFRWAELEQLVFSQAPLERRLVASSLACLPHSRPPVRRHELRGERTRSSLAIIAMLLGDDERLVQTALSWALREWAEVDQVAVEDLLRDQAAVSVEHGDGHRAVVLRDALSAQPPDVAAEIRTRLSGVRRRPGAPATSQAARMSEAWAPQLAMAHAASSAQGERYARVRP